MPSYDLIIIGAGISGMTAALGAKKAGIKDILVIERGNIVGGLINQCIHNGFGEKFLGTKVTGPEYIDFIEDELEKTDIKLLLNTDVLDVSRDKTVTYVNSNEGVKEVTARAIIFSMGAIEKYAGYVKIPTNGLTGIFTVGEAHRQINLEGYMPGKNTIIVAKNKWGFILARRLIIEGGKVEAVILDNDFNNITDMEINNIIDGFDIPIIENSEVVEVQGIARINKVRIMNLKTNETIEKECDSLLLTVGFVPENDILNKLKVNMNSETQGPEINGYQTSIDGIFACGNIIYGEAALHMDETDGIDCGIKAADYIKKYIY